MSPPGARRPAPSRALWTALRHARRPGSPSTTTLLRALPRLVTATLGGDYRGMSRSRLALVSLAAGYVVSPVDLLPESLLGPLGMADDAAMLAWLAGTVLTEAEAFLAWERAGRPASGRAPERPAASGRDPHEDPRMRWPGFSAPRPGPAGGTGGSTGSRTGPGQDGGDGPDVVVGEVVR